MSLRSRSAALLAVPALAALVLAGCGSSEPGSVPDPGSPVTASDGTVLAPPGDGGPSAVAPTGPPEDVTTGLDAPWSVAFHGSTALISERDTGRVLELLADGSTREVATIDDVEHGGEGGLLGLAVADGGLFAYSTGPDGNRVQRLAIEGAPGSLSLGRPATVIDGLPSDRVHNGGRLAVGPDGMLYVSVGDAADPDAAQDVESPNGTILRLRLDGSVPEDNPFPGSPVWSYGHRNVQGMAWAADGTMFATEFGANTWDELNLIVPGENYGWPVVEGRAGREGFVDPVQQWATSEASPSGLARIGGTLFVANLRGRVLRSVPVADPSTAQVLYDEYGRIRAAVAAPDGSLWFVTNNTDGRGDPGPGDDRIVRVPVG